MDKDGNSKGYGFVHFADPSSAKSAIEAVNGAQLGDSDKVVTVTEFVSKQDRGDPKSNFTNVYVKNLPSSVTSEEEVKKMFGEYGEISSVALMKVWPFIQHMCGCASRRCSMLRDVINAGLS